MFVLVTYDVNTETSKGRARLRKVAKQCTNYGTRVQNSVFECVVNSSQMVLLKKALSDIINEETDSLRFYYLGNKYKTKIEHIGVDKGIKVEEPLIF
jgi:CRISPR-associated protein Cas2